MELKTLKIIDDKELNKFLQNVWGENSHMIEFCKKQDVFYKTKDGYIINFTPAKNLSITKTIWYDDELPKEMIPSANLENFIDTNIQYNCNNYDFIIEDITPRSKFVLIPNFYNIAQSAAPVFYKYGNESQFGEKIRDMDNDEIDDFLNILLDIKNKYIERLNKYFKKYPHKISSCGYWANR